jgi:hypothetical protein
MSANNVLRGINDALKDGQTIKDADSGAAVSLSSTAATLPAVTITGRMTVEGQILPASATISPAAGSANICLVTVTVLDGAGTAMARPVMMDIFLSDAATGAALTGTSASGTVVAGASGKDIATLTTKKALRVQTDVTGVYILAITDTAKTGFYPCVQLPMGQVVVGSQLVTANYG